MLWVGLVDGIEERAERIEGEAFTLDLGGRLVRSSAFVTHNCLTPPRCTCPVDPDGPDRGYPSATCGVHVRPTG